MECDPVGASFEEGSEGLEGAPGRGLRPLPLGLWDPPGGCRAGLGGLRGRGLTPLLTKIAGLSSNSQSTLVLKDAD